MLQVDVSSNLEDVIGNLTELEATQVPFAWVLALNRTASAGQSTVRDEMPSRFIIRNDWTARGVRTQVASKSKPVALVFTKDWYMEQQEAGATRVALSGKLFIPGRSLKVREGCRSHGKIIASMRPAPLMRKAQKEIWRPRQKRAREGETQRQHRTPFPFLMEYQGVNGLWIRERGGSEAGGNKSPIDLLYLIVDTAKIPKRWGFERTTSRVADTYLRREFIKALDAALKSYKPTKSGPVAPIRSSYVDHLLEHDGTGRDSLSGGVLSSLER